MYIDPGKRRMFMNESRTTRRVTNYTYHTDTYHVCKWVTNSTYKWVTNFKYQWVTWHIYIDAHLHVHTDPGKMRICLNESQTPCINQSQTPNINESRHIFTLTLINTCIQIQTKTYIWMSHELHISINHTLQVFMSHVIYSHWRSFTRAYRSRQRRRPWKPREKRGQTSGVCEKEWAGLFKSSLWKVSFISLFSYAYRSFEAAWKIWADLR